MLSRNQRIIIFAGIHMIITIVFGIFFLKPLVMKFIDVYEKVKKVNMDRRIVTSTVNSIPELVEEKKKLLIEYERLNTRLPSEDKVPMIISQISEKTQGLDVNILSITSGDARPLPGKPVLAKPIMIDLITDLKTMAEYLNLIEEIETALAIKRIFVTKKNNVSSPRLVAHIQVETYILNKES